MNNPNKRMIYLVFMVLLVSSASSSVNYINTLDGSNQSIGNNNLIFIDNANGLIGIGTLTPTVKLDVAGTVNATQFTINGSDLYSLFAELTDKIGNTTAEIRAQFSSSDNVSISSGVISINKSFVLSTDKLGNTSVEIWSVIDNETFARLTGFSGENITSGSIADARVVDDLTIASTKTINTTGGLNVSGGAYIGGNVGIGSLNPNEKLTVIGNVNITENLTISGKITGSHKQELEVESIGDVEAGKGMVLLMHFNNDSSVGENYVNGTNSTVYDYSDLENNGTTVTNATNGGPQFTTSGMFGGAFEFDGVDDYVNSRNDSSLNILSDLTLEAWIKPLTSNTASNHKPIIGEYDSPNSKRKFVLKQDNDELVFTISPDGTTTTSLESTNANLVALQLVHIALVYTASAGSATFYKDGIALTDDGAALNTSIFNSGPDLTIGTDGARVHLFNGTIDEVAIYNRSLSADEILEDYKKGFKNVVEGSTLFDDETRIKDNLIVQGNLGVTSINPNGGNVGIGTATPTSYAYAHADNLVIRGTGETGMTISSGGTGGSHIYFANGTAAADTYQGRITFTHPGGYMYFYTGANPRMTIDNTGNVGIGTTGPLSPLHIKASNAKSNTGNWHQTITDTTPLAVGVGGGITFEGRWSDDPVTHSPFGAIDGYRETATNWVKTGGVRLWYSNGTNLVEGLRLNSNGNVGIGTTGPGAKLQVGALPNADGAMSTTLASYAGVLGSTAGNTVNVASFGFDSANTVALGVRGYRTADGSDYTTTAIGLGMDVDDSSFSASQGLWFQFGGNVGIGNNSPDQDLVIQSGASWSRIDAGATQFTGSSSREIKENIAPLHVENILGKIAVIPVNTFDFKEEYCDGADEQCKDKLGLIAEDFYKVFERGSDKSINGDEVQMALWLAVQELSEKNQQLKQKNAELEQRISALELK